MTRGQVDYSKGLIYGIYCKLNDEFYIGSTTNIEQRWKNHKNDMNKQRCQSIKLYNKIREYRFEIFYIELIEYCPCNDKKELERREGELQREKKPTLNSLIARRTQKEYKNDNVGRIKEYHEEYYIDNADIIKEKSKQYNKDNADIIKEYKKQYRKDNADIIKEKSKEYRKENADVIKEYQSQYNKDNADIIKEKSKEYRKDNADIIKEQKKQYRKDNANKIKEQKKQYYLKKKQERQEAGDLIAGTLEKIGGL